MRDPDIRLLLEEELYLSKLKDPETFVLEEFGLCQHSARVDILVVNGILHGYEIKSEADKLDRLENQKSIYNRTLDKVTLVVDESHLNRVIQNIPNWWGVLKVTAKAGQARIVKVRAAKLNRNLDPHSLVQVLWRNEAVALAKKLNIDKSILARPRSVIWETLANLMSLKELQKQVNDAIKLRVSSGVILQLQLDGDLCPRHAT